MEFPSPTNLAMGFRQEAVEMRTPIVVFAAALMAGLVISPVAMAQAGPGNGGQTNTLFYQLLKDPSTGGPAPRRDLSGAWAGPLNAYPGEVPPMTPLGQKRFSLNKSEAKFGTAGSNDPLNVCDPLGFPRNAIFELRGIAFSTMPGKIVILSQYQKIWRDVWMDGRALPQNVDTKNGPDSRMYGYSVGHWENDHTLVIDTTGSDDRTWLNNTGYPHSANAHFQERYTRVDHNNLRLTVTVDDPAMYTRPFVLGNTQFRWIPDQHTEEQMCMPSEAMDYMKIIAGPAAVNSKPR
jgi:hypothetical protein